MPDIVYLEEAVQRLRLSSVSDVPDLQTLIDHATAVVMDYCNSTAYWRAITATWTDTTVPAVVKEAILKQVAYLNQNRGDEAKTDDDGLAPGIRWLLTRYRDPVVA